MVICSLEERPAGIAKTNGEECRVTMVGRLRLLAVLPESFSTESED